MHATEIERSPGTPSSSVTTRRRFTPHGTSCSFLQAVTQPLHSMQRSESHRNFIRAMIDVLLDRRELAERALGFLHRGHRIVAVGERVVGGVAAHPGGGAVRVAIDEVLALEP